MVVCILFSSVMDRKVDGLCDTLSNTLTHSGCLLHQMSHLSCSFQLFFHLFFELLSMFLDRIAWKICSCLISLGPMSPLQWKCEGFLSFLSLVFSLTGWKRERKRKKARHSLSILIISCPFFVSGAHSQLNTHFVSVWVSKETWCFLRISLWFLFILLFHNKQANSPLGAKGYW